MSAIQRLISWFSEVGIADVALVGGKNASLGEMYRELAPPRVRIPNGFAITAEGYRRFLRVNGLEERIREAMNGLEPGNVEDLQRRGNRIRQLVLNAEFPADLRDGILAAYRTLSESSSQPVDVAVRSSATAEDLPGASFAGQQETYLNVRGEAALLASCRRCFASLFTDRAISYRNDQGFDHFKVALSIGVQQMVRSDLASSGVLFTLDTETGFRDVVLISAAYGLGENVVQGAVNPDEYLVFKTTLRDRMRPILKKSVGTKEFKMIYDVGGEKGTRNIPVSETDRSALVLIDDEILELARMACTIEAHYTKKNGRPTPMDIEWAKDGVTGELFIVQARPETIHSRKAAAPAELELYRMKERGIPILRGQNVGEKIASGPARIIRDVKDLSLLQDGEILVAGKTDPDWEPVMKKAAAIVTDRGGRTCHAAIVSRELGVPAVIGTGDATTKLRNGQKITVSCAQGGGEVYDGALPFEIEKVKLKTLPRPNTKIMMNLADPEEAFRASLLPNAGVGLVRMEFIVGKSIRVHPMALVHPERVEEPGVRREIERMTRGYGKKSDYFVDRLAQGVGMIAAAFYPKEVIVRMSDFKTNEYANLLGGKTFEPIEENPMIGFRGASRYYDPRYREGFGLECLAMKKVREEMGLTNVKLMIPFCRTPEEGRKVISEMEANGLKRGDHGLEIYMMCEIPSNAILADRFAQSFDGFSIGSNDLTQLVLGVDRDSEILESLFDERDEAVTKMISQAIRAAKSAGRKIGICGQAPSDYPEFSKFLVGLGIDSISLNPDSVLKTLLLVADAEKDGTITSTQPLIH